MSLIVERDAGARDADPSAPASGRRRVLGGRLDRDLALLLGLLILFTIIGVLWDVRYRHNQPFDIDESGYLSISLADFHALGSGGLWSWVKQVQGPTEWSPITTLLSTPFYLLLGARALAGLMSPLLLMLVAIAATFGLTRRILPRSGMWIATLLVACSPVIIDFSRSYIFVAAATAVTATALYCFQRSRQLESVGWSVLFGAAVGALPLARTMTVAFVPAYLVLIVIAVLVPSGNRRLRLRNGALAILAGLGVSTAWLAFDGNATLVWDYLTQYGYGSASASYGKVPHHSLFSYAAWRLLVQDLGDAIFLPQLLVFAVSCLFGLVMVCRQLGRERLSGLWPLLTHPLVPAVVVAAEGFTALASSSNNGDGFAVPLVPALCIISGWALSRVMAWRPGPLPVRAVLVVVLGMCLIPALPIDWALAKTWKASVPALGETPITSGEGLIVGYLGDQGTGGHTTNWGAQRLGRAWTAEDAYVANQLASSDPGNALVSFGFRHRIVNINSVDLVRSLDDEPQIAVTMVPRLSTGDSVRGYVRWLTRGLGGKTCILLTSPGIANEFFPSVTNAKMVAAARQTGFTPVGVWPAFPDGRVVTQWRRASTCPA